MLTKLLSFVKAYKLAENVKTSFKKNIAIVED